MSYFPLFLRLDNRRVLLVGGGTIACEKLKRLLEFTDNVSIISPDIGDEMSQIIYEKKLHFMEKFYEKGDIKSFDIVVVATNDIELQAQIYDESRESGCLCNCVDLVDCCDFTFPSYIKNGDLTIAISTAGSSPAVAKQLKHYLFELIPKDIDTFLQEMKNLRKTLPKGKERMNMLEKKAKDYINNWSKR